MKAYKKEDGGYWIFHKQFVVSVGSLYPAYPIVYDLAEKKLAMISYDEVSWHDIHESTLIHFLEIKKKAKPVDWKNVQTDYSVDFVKDGLIVRFKDRMYGFGKAEAVVRL